MYSLTKQQLIEAHEQGLTVQTNKGNIKIVSILGDVYGVHHIDTNSKLVKWWLFENFERNDAKIKQTNKVDLSILKEGEIYYLESNKYKYIFKFRYTYNNELLWDSCNLLRENEVYDYCGGIRVSYITELRLPTEIELELFYSKFPELKPKPKYNGRAVKCDSVEQMSFINSELNEKVFNTQFLNSNNCICISDKNSYFIGKIHNEEHFKHECYEIISFSQYCTENGITEPNWIQGFEAKDGYNDVVMVSADKNTWHCHLLTSVNNKEYPFHSKSGGSWSYCRYPRKGEINEIKFID